MNVVRIEDIYFVVVSVFVRLPPVQFYVRVYAAPDLAKVAPSARNSFGTPDMTF